MTIASTRHPKLTADQFEKYAVGENLPATVSSIIFYPAAPQKTHSLWTTIEQLKDKQQHTIITFKQADEDNDDDVRVIVRIQNGVEREFDKINFLLWLEGTDSSRLLVEDIDLWVESATAMSILKEIIDQNKPPRYFVAMTATLGMYAIDAEKFATADICTRLRGVYPMPFKGLAPARPTATHPRKKPPRRFEPSR